MKRKRELIAKIYPKKKCQKTSREVSTESANERKTVLKTMQKNVQMLEYTEKKPFEST